MEKKITLTRRDMFNSKLSEQLMKGGDSMSNSNIYDGSNRTKVILVKIDNLTKYNAAKDRVRKRYDYLNNQVQDLMEQFNTSDDISAKQSIQNEIQPMLKEMETLKTRNTELDAKRPELEDSAKTSLESWKPDLPTL